MLVINGQRVNERPKFKTIDKYKMILSYPVTLNGKSFMIFVLFCELWWMSCRTGSLYVSGEAKI